MIKLFPILLPLLLLCSCIDDEMAFTVEASPVKGEIAALADPPQGMVAYEGTFTELNKDGILDVNVGIIATPVPGLELRVYSQVQNLLQTVVTDANGKATFSVPSADLTGVSRLEWAGSFNGKAFRILTNL